MDTVRGGAGTNDQLNITTAGIVNLTAAVSGIAASGAANNLVGFETLNINGTTTGNWVAVDDVATGGATAGDFVTVNGSSVNDTIVAGSVANTGTVAGGAGTDSLTVTAALATVDALKNVTGFETITLSAATVAGLTTTDSLVAAGQSLALTLTGANIFNGSAETDGTFNITGGAAASIYTLGAGNDTLNLAASVAAADGIVINSTTSIGLDRITGFTGASDVLVISKAGLAPATGAAAWVTATAANPTAAVAAGLAGTEFKAVAALGAAGTALDASDDVIVFTNNTFANAAAVNTALAAQNGVTAKSAIIVYTNSTTGFTTVAFDSDIGNATNTVIDLVQLSGTTTAALTAADFGFIA